MADQMERAPVALSVKPKEAEWASLMEYTKVFYLDLITVGLMVVSLEVLREDV